MLALSYDNKAQRADLLRDAAGRFIDDPGFETAVTISLLSNAQAIAGEADARLARGGWWADSYAGDDDGPIGSRLWLVANQKPLDQVPFAIAAAEDALQWMVDDGAALSVVATAERTADGQIALAVTITKLDGTRFTKEWQVPNAVL